jgi:hypothetical protein
MPSAMSNAIGATQVSADKKREILDTEDAPGLLSTTYVFTVPFRSETS